MKKFVIILCLFLLLSVTSCSDQLKSKYSKIKNQEISEIIDILGQANEKFIAKPDFNHNCYYWFSKDYKFEEAKQHCDTEKITYIAVVIDIKTKKCVGKAYGVVTPELRVGDIDVFA